MELKNLQTFKVIVQEGSFSKAADKLNYTQSTITFQMQQLEQELSAQLFEKIGRRMMLTKAGQGLLPYVDSVLSSVEKMKSFHTDLAEMNGELHIAVGESLLCYKIPAVLKRFHELAPKGRLFLHSMNCYDIRDSLIAGTMDLGVFYGDVGGCRDLIHTVCMGEHELVLVGSPDVKQQFPDFHTPDQSMAIPFIINEPNCIFRQIFETYLREKKIMLDHTIELWSIPTIKNLVESSVGISYLPRFTVEREIQMGTLCEIETELYGRTIAAVCGHHKNKWVSPLMQLFMGLVADC